MNGETPPRPVENLVSRVLSDVESLARRDPAKAVLTAMAAGLALHVLPARYIIAGVTAVTLVVTRPLLLTLGIIKALELCRSQNIRTP